MAMRVGVEELWELAQAQSQTWAWACVGVRVGMRHAHGRGAWVCACVCGVYTPKGRQKRAVVARSLLDFVILAAARPASGGRATKYIGGIWHEHEGMCGDMGVEKEVSSCTHGCSCADGCLQWERWQRQQWQRRVVYGGGGGSGGNRGGGSGSGQR